jgi:hypothetical protein
VVCGSVGLFEVEVPFDAEARAAYAREGDAFVRARALQIASAPQRFTARPDRELKRT